MSGGELRSELRGPDPLDAHVFAGEDVDRRPVPRKPFPHLHTQFNRDLPWDTIDMDFMNLNQAAHGDREAGFSHPDAAERKVVVGHWGDPEVQDRLGAWMRAARAWHDWQGANSPLRRQHARGRGDRRRQGGGGDPVRIPVTAMGWAILWPQVNAVADAEVKALADEYEELYAVAPELRKGGARHESLREGRGSSSACAPFWKRAASRVHDHLRGSARAEQLPGLAVQRLMADGLRLRGEGDWKTAALLRAMKVMGEGLPGGTSFMEDYTYHLEPGGSRARRAHAGDLPAIAAGKPSLEIHPLGIGGKEDPVRLVFDAPPGPGANAASSTWAIAFACWSTK